jgi:hypothetical protein
MSNPEKSKIVVRPIQFRDLGEVQLLLQGNDGGENHQRIEQALHHMDRWYGAIDFVRNIPNLHHYRHCLLVAEVDRQLQGVIQVSPFNRTRSTWQVESVVVNRQSQSSVEHLEESNSGDRQQNNHQTTSFSAMDLGSQLLRYCFEKIVEASTWVLEVDVNDKAALGLYRHNGFQPLACLTYWEISPEILQELNTHTPDLPNLLPVRNTDAQLLYQLDTVAMPPLLRQVFDRQVHDFKLGVMEGALKKIQTQLNYCPEASNYVFESQRKAAIGYFHLDLSSDASQSHRAELTVHPAYTWLYPELMAQMSQICQASNAQLPLQLVSADYQPEREEYLQKIGAQRTRHSLLMSRSVWHKVREAKHISLEGLQLSDVLSGLQPVRNPIPSRYEASTDPQDGGDAGWKS